MWLPGKSFLIAGVVAWSGLIAAMVTSASQDPVATAAPVARPVMVANARFDARWDDGPQETVTVTKGDRLPLPRLLAKPIVVAPPPEPEATATVEDEARPAREKRHARERRPEPRERNVCTRHNMRKVWVTSKRWRCRR